MDVLVRTTPVLGPVAYSPFSTARIKRSWAVDSPQLKENRKPKQGRGRDKEAAQRGNTLPGAMPTPQQGARTRERFAALGHVTRQGHARRRATSSPGSTTSETESRTTVCPQTAGHSAGPAVTRRTTHAMKPEHSYAGRHSLTLAAPLSLDFPPSAPTIEPATTVVADLLAGQQNSTGAVPSFRTQVDLV